MADDPQNPAPSPMSQPTVANKSEPSVSEPPAAIKWINWFSKNPWYLVGILTAAVFVYLVFRLTGHDILCPALEKVGVKCSTNATNYVEIIRTNVVTSTNAIAVEVSDAKTAECIAFARSHNKPYWIESATEIVHLQFDRSAKTRTGTFQVIYVLRLLRDVHRNDQSFKEWFNSSDQSAKLTRISGSDEESVHGNVGKFEVQIEGKAGDVRTVVTGGRYVWPYDAQPRNGLGDKIRLGKNDDTWNYPNDADDAIREYTLLIYSDAGEITPVGQAAKWLKDGKLDTVPHRFNQPDPASGPALPSISARWENVLGEQEVAIHFAWPPL